MAVPRSDTVSLEAATEMDHPVTPTGKVPDQKSKQQIQFPYAIAMPPLFYSAGMHAAMFWKTLQTKYALRHAVPWTG